MTNKKLVHVTQTIKNLIAHADLEDREKMCAVLDKEKVMIGILF